MKSMQAYLMHSKKMKTTDKTALIIAPHPDDETFGCAGLIARKIAEGARVYVVFLTCGEKSLPDETADTVMKNRQISALKATKALGVDEEYLYWLSLPDGKIPRKGEAEFRQALSELSKIVKKNGIREIYAPGSFEGWPDHPAACEMGVEVAENADGPVELFLYWVWAWYYVGLWQAPSMQRKNLGLLPIDDVYDKKEEAMQAYFSAKTPKGDLYIGHLPPVFLKAFAWRYELFEKVDLHEV